MHYSSSSSTTTSITTTIIIIFKAEYLFDSWFLYEPGTLDGNPPERL